MNIIKMWISGALLLATTHLAFAGQKAKAESLSTFSREEVAAWMKVENAINAKKGVRTLDGLDLSLQPPVKDMQPGAFKRPEKYKVEDLQKYTPFLIPTLPESGFQGLKLRESWADILATEDPSVDAKNSAYKDLKGAKFSYSRNEKKRTDAWVAQGALVAPFVWYNAVTAGEGGWNSYGFVPSATINRLHDEADIKEEKEKDSVIFRIGGFGNYSFAKRSFGVNQFGFNNLIMRANFAYQTDTEFRSSLPAGEIEFEPKLWFNTHLGVGYRQILLGKDSEFRDKEKPLEDNAWVAYQARIRIRGEYGQLTRKNEATNVNEDKDFMHVGAKMGIEFDPLFLRRLSGSVSYSYLPSIFGPAEHDTLVEAELSFKLWEHPDGRKASISAKYVKGGLDFSQDQAETFYIGLSALY